MNLVKLYAASGPVYVSVEALHYHLFSGRGNGRVGLYYANGKPKNKVLHFTFLFGSSELLAAEQQRQMTKPLA